MWWSHEALTQEGIPLAQALVGAEKEAVMYGRLWWRVEDEPPPEVYCSECHLIVAPHERFKVVVDGKTYHGNCFKPLPKFTYLRGGVSCVEVE